MPVRRSQRPKTLARRTPQAAKYAHAPRRRYSCSSFSSAHRMQSAGAGTALLDVVAELMAEQQKRLLRFLVTGQLRGVGAVR